jgi:hypothetical protein
MALGILRPTGSAAAAPEAPQPGGALATSVLGARTHVDVTVARAGVAGRLRVLTRAELKQVRADARRTCIQLGNRDDQMLEASRDFIEEVATRSIAIAVRRPDNEALPLATLEEWETCDDEQIAALWQVYKDLEESLDPSEATCDAGDALLIEHAARQRNRVVLRSLGVRRLADFLIADRARQSTEAG